VKDLSVEVGKFHTVAVGNANAADTTGGKIIERRTAQSARPYYQDAAAQKPGLTFLADLGDQNVSAVSFLFSDREETVFLRLDGWCQFRFPTPVLSGSGK
jgi:hypothetical protein